MTTPESASARRVQAALATRGFDLRVVELPASTRTAAEAAEAIGCTVGQIAKSLIFKGETSEQPILVIASGVNRVNEKALALRVGEKVRRADAAFVRAQTGFAIGGVPPVGHDRTLVPFIDQDLLQHAEIWAAAGTPHAVFQLKPENLVTLTGGQVIPVT